MAGENETPSGSSSGIGDFFGGILDNFGTKKDGAKWGAIAGAALTTIVGYMFGGGFGALLGLIGGAVLGGSFNDLAGYIGRVTGLGGSRGRDLDFKPPAPTRELEVMIEGPGGKGKKLALPSPNVDAIPELPEKALQRSLESQDAMAQKGKKMTAAEYRQAEDEAHTNDRAIQTTLATVGSYFATRQSWESPKGGRLKMVETVQNAAREFAGSESLNEEHMATLERFVPHLRGMGGDKEEKYAQSLSSALPSVKAYDTDKMLRDLAANEFKGLGSYERPQDLELMSTRSWNRDHPKDPKAQNEWKEFTSFRKANAALTELETQRDRNAPDWDKLSEAVITDRWFTRTFRADNDINDKDDVIVMSKKSPEKMLEMATRMYDQSYASESKLHDEIAKVIEYSNAQIKINALRKHMTDNIGPVAADMNLYAKTTMTEDQKAGDEFKMVGVPMFNQTGIAILSKGDLEPSGATNNQPGKYITYFDSKNPNFGKDKSGVVTVIDFVENGEHKTRVVEGEKNKLSDGILWGAAFVNHGKAVGNGGYDMDKVMNASSATDLRRFAWDVAGITPPPEPSVEQKTEPEKKAGQPKAQAPADQTTAPKAAATPAIPSAESAEALLARINLGTMGLAGVKLTGTNLVNGVPEEGGPKGGAAKATKVPAAPPAPPVGEGAAPGVNKSSGITTP
jgi:hypothetical protein